MPDSAPPAPEHDVALEQDLDPSLAEDDVDPVKETLDALHAKKEALQSEHPGLAAKIDLMTAANPHQHGRPSFRHVVAYVVQDVEKATAAPLATSQLTREEMTRLANSAPGLKNARMLDLLRMTSDLRDEPLVDEIRTTGTAIGRQRDQHTPDIRSRIEGLENRILLSQQPDASASPSPASRNDREPDMPRPPFNEPPADVRARRSEADATYDAAHRPPSNRAGPGQSPQQQTQVVFKPSVLDSVFRALRPTDRGNGAPWEPLPTPLEPRLTRFEQSMREGRDDIALRAAEQAGRAALDALNAFRNGEGASIINRIHEAGRNTPGGPAEVLAEMRPGGRFADLRQQFNNAMAADRGFSAAYDRAADALAAYGKARTDIGQIIGRRSDATQLTTKFEQMDGEIGKAAGETPSRRDGKTMIDDLTKQLVELFQRAVDGLRSMFGGRAGASSRPGPSPSP